MATQGNDEALYPIAVLMCAFCVSARRPQQTVHGVTPAAGLLQQIFKSRLKKYRDPDVLLLLLY
jgi:hypothetical protein